VIPRTEAIGAGDGAQRHRAPWHYLSHMRRNRWDATWVVRIALVAGLVVAAATACGDDDDAGEGAGDGSGGGSGGTVEPTPVAPVDEPDGAALAAAFGRAADAAYAAGGANRQQDFTMGTTVDDCPILTDETPAAVAAALGAADADAATPASGNYLGGPPDERELLTCSIQLADGATAVGTSAGSLPFDRDGVVADLRTAAERTGSTIEEVDGEAPGLDPAHVVGVVRDGEAAIYVWVAGGFHVALSGPADTLGPEVGFPALALLVDHVATALTG
jgi:hypothetical protein